MTKTFEVAYDWFIDDKIRLEMSEWMRENIKHHYMRHHKYCDVYCFSNKEDAVAFKMRWI